MKPTSSGTSSDFAVERLESGEIERDEARLEDEVLRRVAGDGELRSENQIGAAVDELAVGLENLAMIAGQIADGGVELREANFHGAVNPRKLADAASVSMESCVESVSGGLLLIQALLPTSIRGFPQRLLDDVTEGPKQARRRKTGRDH